MKKRFTEEQIIGFRYRPAMDRLGILGDTELDEVHPAVPKGGYERR